LSPHADPTAAIAGGILLLRRRGGSGKGRRWEGEWIASPVDVEIIGLKEITKNIFKTHTKL